MVTNNDVVCPQAPTRYIGHEHIVITYQRLGCSYYPEAHEMNPPGLSSLSDV